MEGIYMLNHWPSGGRDTTEFPDINVVVEPNFRKHLEAFCNLEGIGWNDFERQEQISGLSVTPQRYRSYRKMYQNLGFIYPENTKIKLSSVGKKLSQVPSDIQNRLKSELLKIGSIALKILSRYQLLNPTEEQKSELPADCDVLPCICFWKTMLDLDNKLHHEELNRVLLRVMRMADLDDAIRKIAKARSLYTPYSKHENALASALGEPVHTNQPTARVAYWYSFVGWGGLLIERNQDQEGFRHFNASMIDAIRSAVQNPPHYYPAIDEDDWERYYIGDVADSTSAISSGFSSLLTKLISDLELSRLRFSKNILARFIASLCAKPFMILTGLSGSGKTKLAQAFAYWITEENTDRTQSRRFSVGENVTSSRVIYKVTAADSLSVTFTQTDTGTKVNLPYDLIGEWIDVIKEKDYNSETPPRTLREAVAEKTSYSTQLNSFETHLKAAALHLMDKPSAEDNNACQYVIVPVGADWTNREPLLGYPNALEEGKYIKPENGVVDLLIEACKEENSDKPYFLILDEMNLSHVERYFADFLSAMESDEYIHLHSGDTEWDGVPPKLRIPENLFIIGTVNIDETTYMFSPKVLDRANVIDFSVSDSEMKLFLENPAKPDMRSLNGAGSSMAKDFMRIAKTEITDFGDSDVINSILLEFFNELKKAGAEFGYRTASEIYRFTCILNKMTENEEEKWDLNDIIDAAVMQKLLPKVHGSRSKLVSVLKTLAGLCLTDKADAENIINKPEGINYSDRSKIRFPLSLEKIMRMKKRVVQDGFTSFAEA